MMARGAAEPQERGRYPPAVPTDWEAVATEGRALLAALPGLDLDLERARGFARDVASGRLCAANNRFAVDPSIPLFFRYSTASVVSLRQDCQCRATVSSSENSSS